jgi:hypothetical protein
MWESHALATTGRPEACRYSWDIREFGSRLMYHDGRLQGYKHCLGYMRDRRLMPIVCSNLDWTRPCLIAHGIHAIIVG